MARFKIGDVLYHEGACMGTVREICEEKERLYYKEGGWDRLNEPGLSTNPVASGYREPVAPPNPAPTPAPLNVCEEANKVAGGDRQRDYGHPLDNHQRIAALWNAYLNNRPKPDADITATDAALLMILLKVAREINTPKRDNLVDICGYAKCLESMYAEIEKRKGGAA